MEDKENFSELKPVLKSLKDLLKSLCKDFFSILKKKLHLKSEEAHAFTAKEAKKVSSAVPKKVFIGFIVLIFVLDNMIWFVSYKVSLHSNDYNSMVFEEKLDTAKVNLEAKIREEYKMIYQAKLDSIKDSKIVSGYNPSARGYMQKSYPTKRISTKAAPAPVSAEQKPKKTPEPEKDDFVPVPDNGEE